MLNAYSLSSEIKTLAYLVSKFLVYIIIVSFGSILIIYILLA